VCGPSRPCTRSAHSPFTAVYTAVYDGRCTAVRHVHTSTPQLKGRVRAMYTSVYTASTQSCTWQIGLHGRVHGPRRHVAAVDRVHVPYTAMYMFVYTVRHSPYAAVCRASTQPYTRAMYTARTRLCKCSCTRAVYTAAYTARRVHGRYSYRAMYTFPGGTLRPCAARHGRVHGPRRHVAAVGRVHVRNPPCTQSCTRPIHSRVHVPLHGPCTRPRSRTVCRNGPHTAVACRLGTCTRPGRPTCRIHGPDDPCTRPSNGRVHGPLHDRVRAM